MIINIDDIRYIISDEPYYGDYGEYKTIEDMMNTPEIGWILGLFCRFSLQSRWLETESFLDPIDAFYMYYHSYPYLSLTNCRLNKAPILELEEIIRRDSSYRESYESIVGYKI